MPLPSNGRICGGGKRGRAGERKICGRGSMEKRPSRAAQKGSRDNVPCRVKGRRPLWGLGQCPNCFTCDHSKGKINKGAGSEASLPVTLRSRRSAPKLLFPQDSVKNQKVKQANALDAEKNRVPAHFYCTKKEKPLMQLPLIFAYFSMDSSQESNGLMPSRPATVGATFARPKPWPSFNS